MTARAGPEKGDARSLATVRAALLSGHVPAVQQRAPGRVFRERFKRILPGDIRPGVGHSRKFAQRILRPVPYDLIPTTPCPSFRGGSVPVADDGDLWRLCECLDEMGASPASLTAAQVYAAWKAAGFEPFLRRPVARRLSRDLYRQIIAPGLVDLVLPDISTRMRRRRASTERAA